MARRLNRPQVLLVMAGALVALYLLATLLVLPWYLRRTLIERVEAQTGGTATLGSVALHPLFLTATLRDFSLSAETSGPIVAFERLYVNPSLVSLLRDAFKLEVIELERPVLLLERHADGTWGFMDLLPQVTPEAPDEGEPPALHIAEFHLIEGRIDIEDESLREPLRRSLQPITVRVGDLRTQGNLPGQVRIEAISEVGERLVVEAEVALDPITVVGALHLGGVNLAASNAVVGEYTGLNFRAGVFEAQSRFELRFDETLQANLSQASVLLTDAHVTEAATGETLLNLGRLELAPTSADLATRQVQVGALTLNGLELFLARSAEGRFNILEALGLELPSGPPEAPAEAGQPTAEPAFALTLAGLNVQDSRLHWRDAAVQPVVDETLAISRLELGPMAFPFEGAIPLALEAELLRGSLALQANVEPGVPAAQGTLSLRQLELAPLLPYAQAWIAATQATGRLTVEGQFQWPGAAEQAVWAGDSVLEDFLLRDAEGNDLARLALHAQRGVRLTLDPLRVEVAEIEMQQPFIAGAISESGMFWPSFLKPPATPEVDPAAPASGTPAAQPELQIARLSIQGGGLQARDVRFPNPTLLAVRDFNLTGTDLRYGLDSRGEIVLDAVLNETGQLRGQGEFALPPEEQAYRLSFTGSVNELRLRTVSNYAEVVTGYGLSGGRLEANLDYTLEGPTLRGQNRLTFHNFELGQRSEMPDVPSLPMPLAVTLLKGIDGNIVLNLPVQGDINDPQFGITQVVVRALTNILTRVATSPFRLLGSVFAGSQEVDLGRIRFDAGSATLDPSADEKLDALARALQERPELDLLVPAAALPSVDGPVLQAQLWEERVQARMAEQGLTGDEGRAQAMASLQNSQGQPAPAQAARRPEPPPAAAATRAEPATAPASTPSLGSRFNLRRGPAGERIITEAAPASSSPRTETASEVSAEDPASPAGPPDLAPGADDIALDEEPSDSAGDAATDATGAGTEVPEAALTRLGQQRAEALRQRLIALGADAARVRIVDRADGAEAAPQGDVALVLGLE